MNDQFEQLTTRVKKMTLSPEDKDSMREALLSYIKTHPVRVGDPTRHHYRREELKAIHNKLSMPIIVIIALLLSGGVSYAAEGSVPGEALYVIKTEVNEPLRGAFALSSEAQAQMEAKFAAERLEEAEILAHRGALSADISANLKERFVAHAERAGERIEKLEGKNAEAAVEVSSEFEASLKAHERILDRLEVRLNGAVTPILGTVTTHVSLNKEHRERAERSVEANADMQEAAEGKARAAAHKIAEVTAYIERKSGRIDAETRAEVDAKLAIASSTYATANAKLSAAAYGEAFSLYQQALRDAQEAKAYAEFDAELKEEREDENRRDEGHRDVDRDKDNNRSDRDQSTSTEIEIESENEIEIEDDEIRADGRGKIKLDLGL